jgi:hypothetical protein
MREIGLRGSTLITVNEDRFSIVVKDSQVARRLETLNLGCSGDIYGLVSPLCFNVEHLTWCKRQIVSNSMNPSSYVPSSSEVARCAMDSRVKDIWIKRLSRSHGFKVGMVNYHAVDNTMSLYGFVDCMLNTSDLVSNVVFRYASSRDMIRLKEKGPYKKDAITSVMLGYMVHCPNSMIVYGHGRESMVFHTRRVDAVVDSVKEKCDEMGAHLLAGTLPPLCRSHKCKFCYKK